MGKIKKLSELTSSELKEGLKDEYFKDCLAEQILRVCGSFSKTHKLYEMEYEDYINFLFMCIWERLDKFDDTRGNLTTFIYVCLSNCFSMELRKIKNKPDIISLNTQAGDNANLVDYIEDDFISKLDELIKDEEFANMPIELQMISSGLTQKEIAKILGKSQALISKRIKNYRNVLKIKRG